jgi:6-phosphofructokinase 1
MPAIAVLTSGGDAPGMNTAVWAVTRLAAARGHEVIGIRNGYDGLIAGRTVPLTRRLADGRLVPEDLIDVLAREGGTHLGSSRSERFRTPDGRVEAAGRLAEAGVDGLVVVGGNGSIAGAHALSVESGIRVVAIPASIDNDIGLTADAIGVDSALNTIVDACDRISDTARSHRRAFIVEVMGRDSGYLAMASAVATGADAVLLPERRRSFEQAIESIVGVIRDSFGGARDKQRVLIIKAEGVDVDPGRLVEEVSRRLADVENLEVRSTVLGHLVRGGDPSFRDRLLAGRLSLAAVSALLAGADDVMAGWGGPTDLGDPTSDPHVRIYPIPAVLEATRALLDGTSEVTAGRLRRMEAVEGVLSL